MVAHTKSLGIVIDEYLSWDKHIEKAQTQYWCDKKSIYQLLHQGQKVLAVCNIQGERACQFSFNIAQSQYFVALMQ